MLLYAKIINQETKEVEVGTGDNASFYESLGMSKMDVGQAWNGAWYLSDFVPAKPEDVIKEEIKNRLLEELKTLDDKASRPMRAILTGTATEEDRSRLAELETQAANIRQQLRELEQESK